jgi:hypothetical protein
MRSNNTNSFIFSLVAMSWTTRHCKYVPSYSDQLYLATLKTLRATSRFRGVLSGIMEYTTSLERLEIDDEGLLTLPLSLFNVTSLVELRLTDCRVLTELPVAISSLQLLRVLSLRYCYELTHLPASIGELQQLLDLSITSACFGDFTKLTHLPAEIGQLKNLETLNLSGMSNLTSLPETICNLRRLQRLGLDGCKLICRLDPCLVFTKLHSLEMQGQVLARNSYSDVCGHLLGVNLGRFKIFLLRRRRRTLPPELWDWIYNEFLY